MGDLRGLKESVRPRVVGGQSDDRDLNHDGYTSRLDGFATIALTGRGSVVFE